MVGFIICVECYIDMLFVDFEYICCGVVCVLLKFLIKFEFEFMVDVSIIVKFFFECYGF